MSTKIAEQIRRAIEDQGPCKTVPKSQVDALLAGRGRVEFLVAVAEEYGLELRLERKSRRKENADLQAKV